MKKFILILVSAVVVVGAWLLVRGRSGAADDADAKPVATVEVTKLRVLPVSQTIPAYGVVEAAPAGAHSISLGYDCIVTEVDANVGSRVDEGAAIMKVVPTADAKMQLDSARSMASLASKSLAQTRERFDLRLATNQDVLAAEQSDEDARIKVTSLEGRGVSGSGLVAAPAGGVVTKLDWQPGATVPAGTPLVMVTEMGKLAVHFSVEASDASLVKAGQAVSVSSASRPGDDPVRAAVQSVGASIDAATGAVDVRVSLPAGGSWFVGEHVRGEIVVQTKTTLVAPHSAVLPDGDDQVLFTVADGKAVKHVVKTGISGGDLIEVTAKDIKAGDDCVSLGNYELEDGMAVQVGDKAESAKVAEEDKK
jgi:membrane fusion protein, multidrug efflux system